MRGSFGSLFARVAVVLLSAFLASSFAADAAKPHYLVTNDDVPPQNETSVTFYTVNANGLLTMKEESAHRWHRHRGRLLRRKSRERSRQ